MSKIFEALQKTEGSLATVANAVFDDAIVTQIAQPDPDQRAAQQNGEASEGGNGRSGRVRVAQIPVAPGSAMLPFGTRDGQPGEQYRMIRTRISHHPAQPKILLVSSAMPGDGKTISALNLAGALSMQENVRVLLVDCDFRRSSLTKMIGLEPTPGLGEVLRAEATVEASLVQVAEFPNLFFLPSGGASPNPGELLTMARWAAVQKLLCSEFRFIVIDAPPVGAVAEYELLQMACDGVILVVRQDYTNRQLLKNALDAVPQAKQLGVILNCVEEWFLWKTHSYYYYSGAKG